VEQTTNPRPDPSASRPDRRGAPAALRRKIAVVDDDRDVRDFLAAVLEEAGYDVKLAANGLRLVSTLQVDRPDLILLDVMMSWIDGFELCRALKKNPDFCDIPVVFISGRSERADVQQGLSCGAVDYFAKPIDADELLGRIGQLLPAE
jgi:DNA-binding response OmpR family regulator